MGNGIAHVAAQSNLKTILIDIDDNQLNNAMKTISNNLDRQINKNIISTDEKSTNRNRDAKGIRRERIPIRFRNGN